VEKLKTEQSSRLVRVQKTAIRQHYQDFFVALSFLYLKCGMKKTILILLLLTGIICQSEAAHTGRVFIDKNGNGIFDKGESVLPNVMVSDGLNVVKTGTDGSFSLPGHEKERFIFITTPSGYKTNNKHYIPIGQETRSYNFGVQPYKGGIGNDGSHKFIHIADTEIFNTEGHEDWVNNVRNYAQNENAAFIMHTGDICYEKGMNEHIKLMNTGNMGIPMFYGIGNHDLVEGEYGEKLFETIYGPVFYSFDVGSTHYIMTPMSHGDYQPSYTKEDVYHWLKNDLRHVPVGKPVIIFNHDLLTHNDKFLFGINDTEVIDLNAHNLKAWIYGHWHINYMKKQGNVTTICTGTLDKGGIDHSTSAFRVIDVDRKGNVSSRLRYTYINKHIEIASPGTDGFPILISGAVPLTVNTYHSDSPTKEVSYTCMVDGKKLFTNRKMTQMTDWSWKDMIYLTHKPIGKTVTIKATATFRNGEKAEKEIRFTYNNRADLVNLDENWDNLLGNAQHTGVSSSPLPSPLEMVWTSNVGANIYMASPVIHKGKIYVASVDEDLKGKSYIYALESQTGRELWKYPVNNSIKNTIVMEDSAVYAQTAEGSLYAIKTVDGSLKWGTQLHVNGLPALIEGLVISDGVIYAGTGNGLCALNARNGKVLWENKDWQQGEGTTSTLTAGKGMLISSVQWRGLYGNDAETGKMKWHINKNGITNRGATPALHNGLLYVISSKSLFIIEAETGNTVVRKEFPFSVDVTSTPLLTDNSIIFGSVDNGLIAVDRETLDLRWQHLTGNALIQTAPYTRKASKTIETSPVLAGNTVYFGASDGNLYGIDKESGEQTWKHTMGSPLFASVAISGNTLIAVDFGGNVYAFTSKSK